MTTLERIPRDTIQKTMRFKLTVLSPIYIGGRDGEISNARFVNGHVISEEKLFRAFKSKTTLIDEYVEYVVDGGTDLEVFLEQHRELIGDSMDFLHQYAVYRVNKATNIDKMRPFTRDAYHQPYIPGTAIKGAIRTALLYKMLLNLKNHNREKYNAGIAEIRGKLGEVIGTELEKKGKSDVERINANKIDDELVGDTLQSFNYLEQTISEESKHLKDLLKFLYISDTTPLDKDSPELSTVKVVSQDRWGVPDEKNFSIHVESLMPRECELELEFSLKIDKDGLSRLLGNLLLPIPSDATGEQLIGRLLCICEEFVQEVRMVEWQHSEHLWNNAKSPNMRRRLEKLIDFYMTDFQSKKPNLRIGYGCGWTGLTMKVLLEDDTNNGDSELLALVREIIYEKESSNSQRKDNKSRKEPEDVPKSRRLVLDGNAFLPLGWCRIEPI